MPRIDYLPAMSGSNAAELSRTVFNTRPSAVSSQGSAQPQRQSQGYTQSIQMLDNQRSDALNSVTRWFDAQAVILDGQQFEPDRYKREYANLQRQAMNKRTAVQANSVAQARQIEGMQKLVQTGMLAPEQMEQTMLVMAGVPAERVREMFKQEQQQRPMTRLRDLKYTAERIENWRARFKDSRREDKHGKKLGDRLYLVNPSTEKATDTKAGFDATVAYDDAETRLNDIQLEMQQLYNEISPLEKTSIAGEQAYQRFGKTRRGLLGRIAGSGAFGLVGLGLAKLTESKFAPAVQEQLEQQSTAGKIISEPKSKAEYDALSKGTKYKHPDGDIRTKK